jgi:PRTRC genetic system protein C
MTPTTSKSRTFRYAEHTFPEPGAEFTIQQVQAHLAGIFPEIAHATVEENEQKDGTFEITFRKQVARKGSDTDRLPALIKDLADLPALTTTLDDILPTLSPTPTLADLLPHFAIFEAHDDTFHETHWRLSQLLRKCSQIPPTPLPHLPLGF